jgi:hypothetical protein
VLPSQGNKWPAATNIDSEDTGNESVATDAPAQDDESNEFDIMSLQDVSKAAFDELTPSGKWLRPELHVDVDKNNSYAPLNLYQGDII